MIVNISMKLISVLLLSQTSTRRSDFPQSGWISIPLVDRNNSGNPETSFHRQAQIPRPSTAETSLLSSRIPHSPSKREK